MALRNHPQVPDGGWGAAIISRMAVGVEWVPDPPPAKLDLRHELLKRNPERGLITCGHNTGFRQPIVIATIQGPENQVSSAYDPIFIYRRQRQ